MLKSPNQCAQTMNTVRSCFASTVSFLVVAIAWSVADAVVCCNSSSVTSGGEDTSCQNKNRTYHTVEAIGGGTCDDNRTAVPVRKCCPPGQLYDPEVRFCEPPRADRDEYLQRMMQRLRDGFRVVADAVMVGYDYEQPMCNSTQVLVDVPAMEVRGLMEAGPSAIELPPDYCFDLTPSDELVARTCRPRDQYCGQDVYTCVNKCCMGDELYVFDEQYSSMTCKKSETPFKLFVYEIDVDWVSRSNSTVLPYYTKGSCSISHVLLDSFILSMDGSLYRINEDRLVPDMDYCVEYYAKAESLVADGILAIICVHDKAEDTQSSLKDFLFLATLVPSIVSLALTLLVYATLSSLRNVHGYYVMCYVACQLLLFVCTAIGDSINDNINSPLCIPFGYLVLFVYLTTFCWLNVICFDVYWTLRHNCSININTSISVRTIMYHIYCWGFSSIFVSTGYLFQHSQHETLLELAPDIGYNRCFFYDPYRYGFYIFYMLPICVIVTANLILFLLTAIHCSRIKSELNTFNPTDSKTKSFHIYKERFVIGIKLFLVMGIPVIISIIRIIFQIHWIVYDILNAIPRLQGVYIFIIFVAKRKVIMDLRKKFRGSMDHNS
ncbi:G-protein coupled receptor Mth2-like isoform X2 [Metopolophium dirhodum]|uniref:G-protein coupled receptor Mth2-like isoform X2 n=1 Tax=Metopolophium dirhodum TaxID=44670 RepID=UPI0029904837|nr:G-protein coupled receptor Mth2-like isoform X2 [Metopolophium dirhodum]